ncbi:MAG: molybdopterin-binding protein [Oscillospiraceae bacterium]|nr:molybdopterin-binding protein [Oscillospiraceae bacterium]
MRRIPVEKAIGEILCHDMTAIGDGGKEVAFRRGHVICGEDIPRLLSMGKVHIFAWDPDVDEVHEDDAGLVGAKTLSGAGVRFSGPSEGKFALTAGRDGLFTVNREALRALNAVPDYTAATIPGDTPVRVGDSLAGVRIVPLVTRRSNVEQVEALGHVNGGILSVRPFRSLRVGIVITGGEVYSGAVADRFEPVLREKTAQFGGQVLGVKICPDDLAEIRQAATWFLDQGAKLVFFTGGMSVDPDDLTPMAIRQTGADVVVQGAPLQPGNMLMLAYLRDVALIGVPGSAMHHRVTALDVILPRIFAGDRLTGADFVRRGEGGLCLGCETCAYPVCYFGRVSYG